LKGNILITGANGFLGQSILSLMKSSDMALLATDLDVAGIMPDVLYQKADITKSEELTPVLDNVTIVIHAAGLAHVFNSDAQLSEKFYKINEIGTQNVATVAATAGVRHFVLISSVSVYGPCTHGIYDENELCLPVGPYAQSKYNAELRAIEAARDTGMSLTILRFATLYGEGDPGNLRRLIHAIDRRRFIWVGDGSNRKSLLYKGDAACACLSVVQRPASGVNIFNVSAPPCTMREIVDSIGDALDKHPLPFKMPSSVVLFLSRQLSSIPNIHLIGLNQTIKKWLAEDIYDTHRFEEAYGFQTRTGLKDGLKREVDWYLKHGKT